MSKKAVCPRAKVLLRSEDFKPGQLSIAQLRCKQWTCSYCAKRNLNAWRAHLIKVFQGKLKGTKWCFLTLTVPPELHGDPVASVTNLQKVWKRLYDKLRRKYSEKISYVYMYEAHKSGTFHLHAIISLGGTYDLDPLVCVWQEPLEHHPIARYLRDMLPTIGGTWKCDIRRVYSVYGLTDAVSAVLYSLKYMAKAKDWTHFKKHARRIGVTQDIGGLPKPKPSEHNWRPVPWLREEELLRHERIEDISTGEILTRQSFEYGFYPPESPNE